MIRWTGRGAQQNLAILLRTKSNEFSGNQAIDLLIPSVAALRFELQVITKESAPLRWAGTQFDLGSALAQLADLYNSQGQAKQVADYRSQAAAAFRAVLEVFNRQNNPDQWARAQWALGTILFAQSQADPANPSTDLLAQAANALSVSPWKSSPSKPLRKTGEACKILSGISGQLRDCIPPAAGEGIFYPVC